MPVRSDPDEPPRPRFKAGCPQIQAGGGIGGRHQIHTTESAAIATPLFLPGGMVKAISHSKNKKKPVSRTHRLYKNNERIRSERMVSLRSVFLSFVHECNGLTRWQGLHIAEFLLDRP